MIRRTKPGPRRDRLSHPAGADRTGTVRPVPAAAALAATLALGAAFVVTGPASAGAAGSSPDDPVVLASPREAPAGASTEGAHRDDATCQITQTWVHTVTSPARIQYYGGSSAGDAELVTVSPGADWEPFGDRGYTEWTDASDPQWGASSPGEDTDTVQWEAKEQREISNEDGKPDHYQRHVWNPQGPSTDEPPTWPESEHGRWHSDGRLADRPNEEVGVVHKGSGVGSYFYWEVIEGSDPTYSTEYLWQRQIRETAYRYQVEHPENSEVTYYVWSDGTTECPDADEESDRTPGTTESPDLNEEPARPTHTTTETPDPDEEPDRTPGTTETQGLDEEPATPTAEAGQPPAAPTATRAPKVIAASSDPEGTSSPEVPTQIPAGATGVPPSN